MGYLSCPCADDRPLQRGFLLSRGDPISCALRLLRCMRPLLAQSGHPEMSVICPISGQRWSNRPAFLWIAERFGVLRFRLMVKRGPCMRPQASEGEAQHGLFCWTRRVGPGDERLHCG